MNYLSKDKTDCKKIEGGVSIMHPLPSFLFFIVKRSHSF